MNTKISATALRKAKRAYVISSDKATLLKILTSEMPYNPHELRVLTIAVESDFNVLFFDDVTAGSDKNSQTEKINEAKNRLSGKLSEDEICFAVETFCISNGWEVSVAESAANDTKISEDKITSVFSVNKKGSIKNGRTYKTNDSAVKPAMSVDEYKEFLYASILGFYKEHEFFGKDVLNAIQRYDGDDLSEPIKEKFESMDKSFLSMCRTVNELLSSNFDGSTKRELHELTSKQLDEEKNNVIKLKHDIIDVLKGTEITTSIDNTEDDDGAGADDSLNTLYEWIKRKPYFIFLGIWFVGYLFFLITFAFKSIKINPEISSIAERFEFNIGETWNIMIVPFALVTFVLAIISILLNPEYNLKELMEKNNNQTKKDEIVGLVFFGILWAGAIALSIFTGSWFKIMGYITSVIGIIIFLIYFPVIENSRRYNELSAEHNVHVKFFGISNTRKALGITLSILTTILFVFSVIMTYVEALTFEFWNQMSAKGLVSVILTGITAEYVWGKRRGKLVKLTVFIVFLALIGLVGSYVFQRELEQFITGSA